MKKTSFIAGLVLGVLACLAVGLVALYFMYENFLAKQEQMQKQLQAQQSAPQNIKTLQQNAINTPIKTPQDMLAALDKIIEARPNDANAYLQKADILAQTGDYQNALAMYNAAIGLNPSEARAYLNRSVIKMMMGDYDGAVQDLSAAIAVNPELAKAYYNRGVANANMMQVNNALKDFSKAMELFAKQGDSASYQDAAKALSTVNNFAKAGGANPRAKQDAIRKQAKELSVKSDDTTSKNYKSALTSSLSSADAKSALEKFRASSVNADGSVNFADLGSSINQAAKSMQDKQSSAPKTTLDYRADAQKALAKGDYKGAKEALDKAIELNPKDSDLYTQRAMANAQTQDYSSALRDYDSAVAADPKNAKALLDRARLKSLMGNNKGALADLASAKDLYGEQGNKQGSLEADNMANTITGKNVRTTKTDTEAQRLLKEGTNEYNKGNYNDALTKFDQLISRQPDVPELYYNRAITNAALGKQDEALKDYTSAIRRNPRMPDSYIGAANILMQKKDMAKAKEYVEKAIEISPDNSKAYTMQGMIAANEEQPQKALDSFNKAIEKDPEDAGAYLYRGVTQAREGDAEKALKDISVAKQLASAQNNAELMKEAQKYEDMINKARSQQGR